jgi:hypothetical protein
MWRNLTTSGLNVRYEGVADHFVAEIDAQVGRRAKIHLSAAEEPAQFLLHLGQAKEADALGWPEFNPDVDVALVAEPVRQHRSEKGELPHSVPPAEVGDHIGRDWNLGKHGSVPLSPEHHPGQGDQRQRDQPAFGESRQIHPPGAPEARES